MAAPSPTPAPDIGKRLVSERGLVSSASPYASEAGAEVLRAGGNAVDAAVATAFAIGVVEPQMSGLGGSGSMLIWMQADGRADYIDFYATQNAASFRGRTGGETSPTDLRIVGMPTNVAGLLEAHERYGTLSRAQVLAPAIRLAEEGFPINQILAQFIASSADKLNRFPESRAVMLPGGEALGPGEVLKNAELAATLRTVAAQGRSGFYEGAVAQAIVDRLNRGGHPATLDDLKSAPVHWRRPLCTAYDGRAVLSGPPPQTGALVLHTLELLEPFDMAALGLPTHSARAFDVLVSALRTGTADNRGNGDPAWLAVPAAGIASEPFARERARLIGTGSPADTIRGEDAARFDATPPAALCHAYEPYGPSSAAVPTGELRGPGGGGEADDGVEADDGGETTHISVVDVHGNAVALTQTNSTIFGSGARVAGFFLNDSGFRFTEENTASPAATAWRTRTSTIAPTIILEDGAVKMVVGAPGGGRIPPSIVQTIVYVLDYDMDPLDAVRMPRLFPSPNGRRVDMEEGFRPGLLRDARAMGYEPTAAAGGYARMYVIVRRDGRWIGVADPRHDGEVRGH
jgi:gamma-glutamyltranspeptidase/glutathione hydrolase